MASGARVQIRYLLIFWLFIVSTIAYLDRTNISIAAIKIAPEFHLSKIQLGWVFSAFLVGYAAFQIPAGWLAVRYGPRKVLAAGLLWWCLLSALTVFVSPAFGAVLPQLIVLRFALGLGEAVMYPGANQFTASWIPVQERAMANGWIFAGVGAGAGIAPPIVTALMLNYGWRASFWFSAVVGLVGSLGWYLLARDRPAQHPAVKPAELAHIQAGLSKASKNLSGSLPWGRIFASRFVWALTLSYFCFGYITFIFLNWFFIYLADVRGLNLAKSALYAMMPFIAMTICCLAGGAINDWLSRHKSPYIGRCVFAAVALVLTSIFLVLGSRADDAFWASVTLAGGAGALYLSQSSYWAATADFAGPHAGVVSGLMNMGCQIAGAITASLTPWIALHFSWNAAFYVAAAFGVIGAVAWLFVDPRQSLMEG